MFSSERASWRNPKVLVVLVLVFLAGGVAGALTFRGLQRTLSVHQSPGYGQLTYEQMRSELKLDPRQSDQLLNILNDLVQYNADMLDDVRATGKNRIRAILNPEQKKTFEKLCEQMQAKRGR